MLRTVISISMTVKNAVAGPCVYSTFLKCFSWPIARLNEFRGLLFSIVFCLTFHQFCLLRWSGNQSHTELRWKYEIRLIHCYIFQTFSTKQTKHFWTTFYANKIKIRWKGALSSIKTFEKAMLNTSIEVDGRRIA